AKIHRRFNARRATLAEDELPRMILTGLVGLLSALLASREAPPAPPQGVRVMTVEERLIIRVPVAPRPRVKLRWDEEKGPKCLPARAIAGAFLSGPDSI